MEPLSIVVDSREQRPWAFSRDVRVVRAKLGAGDYSILGYEDSIAIERKSLDDLVSTILYSRMRFAAELDRLCRYRFAAVVVEGTPTDILLGRYESEAAPRAVLGLTASIHASWGVPVVWAGSRAAGAVWSETLLRALARTLPEFAGEPRPMTPASAGAGTGDPGPPGASGPGRAREERLERLRAARDRRRPPTPRSSREREE